MKTSQSKQQTSHLNVCPFDEILKEQLNILKYCMAYLKADQECLQNRLNIMGGFVIFYQKGKNSNGCLIFSLVGTHIRY